MNAIEKAVATLGGISKTSREIGVSYEAVRRWVSGSNRITAERAIQIEQATNGAVSRSDLRPDLFAAPPPVAPTPSPANQQQAA